MPGSAEPSDSARKPPALMLSPEAPYPLNGGGALRTASLLHYFGEHYELDLIAFQHSGQEIVRYLPENLVRSAQLIPLREHSNTFAARALRNGSRMLRGRPPLVDRFSGYEAQIERLVGNRRYEVALLEHFWCASYAPLMRRFARRVVIDLHNIESVWHTSCAEASGFPRSAIHRVFARAAKTIEHDWITGCDLALATSHQDAERVRALAPGTPVCVFPNAIPWRDPLPDSPSLAVAFSGNMEYEPNLTGVEWFVREVWPGLRTRFPGIELRLIGKNERAVAAAVAGQPDIRCTGPVEDTFPCLTAAQVCIAPLRSGSGTRLKIIEAWAACRAVVSTSLGAEGLNAVAGESILIADTADAFREAISRLLSDPILRQKVANSGRKLYQQEFTWKVAWDRLSDCLYAAKQ